MIEIDMVPMSKPRQTRSDVWRKRPVVLRWRAWADEIRLACAYEEFVPGNELVMEFYIPMPQSWSKKKKAEFVGEPHTQNRLDIDNLAKAVMDALIKDDGCVHYLRAEKFWSEEGKIKLGNRHRFN
jgi:Holliday junction resolvase RusA-like endonuclease